MQPSGSDQPPPLEEEFEKVEDYEVRLRLHVLLRISFSKRKEYVIYIIL